MLVAMGRINTTATADTRDGETALRHAIPIIVTPQAHLRFQSIAAAGSVGAGAGKMRTTASGPSQLEPDPHHAKRKRDLASYQHSGQIGSVTVRLHHDYLDRQADQSEIVSQASQMRAEGLTILFTEKAQQVGRFDGEFINPLGGHRN